MTTSSLALRLCATTALLTGAARAQQDYTPHRLSLDGAILLGTATAISHDGHISGLGSTAAGAAAATMWTVGSPTTLLAPLAGDDGAEAFGVGPGGLVTGASYDIVVFGHQLRITPRAVVWVGGVTIEVATLFVTGATQLDPIEARDANAYGQILGWGRDASQPAARAFVLDAAGHVTDLGSVLGSGIGNSIPFDINDQGIVVGESTAGDGRPHAFVWRGGVMTDLHDPSWGFSSSARAINERGTIVGSADLSDDGLQYETAVAWVDGIAQPLGGLPGGQTSVARGINEHGVVVGLSTLPLGSPSSPHAVMWRDGNLIDLNTLLVPNSGWIVMAANDIDDDGVIVGEGSFAGAGPQPVALVPNCDGTFEVLGSGCAGGGGFVPRLAVAGCPGAADAVSITAVSGLGGAAGALVFGAGNGTVPFFGCEFQVLPVIPLSLSFTFEGASTGEGVWSWEGTWPANFPPLYGQVWSIDPGSAFGLTASNAISIRP